jgi:hypothetical protein
MGLLLQPNDRPAYGQTGNSLRVELPGDEKAVLERVNDVWRLLIYRDGSVTNRGLFGTPHDILMLLEAEYLATDLET